MNQHMTFTLLLFGFSLGSCSQFPPRKYFYINQSATWFGAQQYCRQHYTDLATFESMDDINGLEPTFPYSSAWIGLWDDPTSWKTGMGNKANSWRWSATGEPSKTAYRSWGPDKLWGPDYYAANQTCVVMGNKGLWYDFECVWKYTFFCYSVTAQNMKQYVYITTGKTWSSAQAYCRQNYVDLATIENVGENTQANGLKPSGIYVWIGLYRVPWMWSDNSPSLFHHWMDSFPKNSGGNQHCVVENPLHEWQDANCGDTKVFICHQVVKTATVVRMTTVTDVNLTDPAIQAQVLQQLGALLTSQGWTDFNLQWKALPKKKDKNE